MSSKLDLKGNEKIAMRVFTGHSHRNASKKIIITQELCPLPSGN